MNLNALILAPARDCERVVTGLTLGERARRVAVRAGVDGDRVHVVRSTDELAAVEAELANKPLVVIRAIDQVVAIDLVEPLRLAEPGSRVAVTDAPALAGALRVDADRVADVLERLRADLAAPLEIDDAERVTVGP